MADEPPARPGHGQGDDLPLRAAPLSAAQLAVYGRQLAARHQAAAVAPASDLLSLLADNAAAIAQACDALDRAAHAGIDLPPAGGRLLDQYHLLDAQVRLARGQLLHGVRPLPRLRGDKETEGEARAMSATSRIRSPGRCSLVSIMRAAQPAALSRSRQARAARRARRRRLSTRAIRSRQGKASSSASASGAPSW